MTAPSKPSHQVWETMRGSASAWWSQRNRRERRLLGSAAALILLALIYLLLIDPALSGRTRLQKELPALRRQAAEMQSLTARAASLSAHAAAQPASPLSKEALDAAFKSRGLKPQSVAMSGDMAKVQLSAVAFTGLVDWLDEAHKTAHWQVVDANISAPQNAQPDSVNATFTLWQPKHE